MLSHAFVNLLNVFHQKNLLNMCRDCVLLCCYSSFNPIHYSFSWSSLYSVHLWFMNFHKVYNFSFCLMGTSVENWLWFTLWFWMSFIPIFISISYSVQGAWWWPHGAIRRSNREPVWWIVLTCALFHIFILLHLIIIFSWSACWENVFISICASLWLWPIYIFLLLMFLYHQKPLCSCQQFFLVHYILASYTCVIVNFICHLVFFRCSFRFLRNIGSASW
jgi:hypothetical protein